MRLIDSHCHFDSDAFAPDREAVFARARAAGVERIISPATTAASWPRLIAVREAYPGVLPAFGLHPMFMAAHHSSHLDALEKRLSEQRPVAVGECGLDFQIDDPDREAQEALFHAQLALAARFDLPVIVHARKSVERAWLMLREFPTLRGVMHSYSGSLDQAQRFVERGFMLGFGGPVTWTRAKRLHRLVAALPLEAILLETDAPDQPGEQHRGERNEPAWLPEVAGAVAALKQLPVETVAETTTANARKLFRL